MQDESQRRGHGETISLSNESGFNVEIAACGAALKAVRIPMGNDRINVVLGYESADDYLTDPYFMGVTLGRYANRIAAGRCFVDGKPVALDTNDEPWENCLHGGRDGLHRQIWSLEPAADGTLVTARHRSPDGAGGFPGNLDISLSYQLLEPFSLVLDFAATSDADTVLSLSNHAYFNLDPDTSTIDTHMLTVMSEHYTPVDTRMIPTGEIRLLKGSDFDFASPTLLADPMSGARHRIDTNFVTPQAGSTLSHVARLDAPNGEIQLLVHTTQPGFQVYTADKLDAPFAPRQGICFETQNFPDAPNQAGFPSPVLRAGAVYRQRTIYEFRLA